MTYHLKDGWFFERMNPEGVIKIEKRKTPTVEYPDGELITSIEIFPNEWASVIASVSQFGDTVVAWKEALEFHGEYI